MKLDQQQQAQHLYFQTGMSKSEIAASVGISRRSLHYWIRQNNWDRLKASAETIPSFLAENCYQVIGNLTEHLLSEARIGQPVTYQEANTIHKLTLTIGKLKSRATLNESMELFGMLAERINAKDPALAAQIAPFLDEIVSGLAAPGHLQARPAKMNDLGFIPAEVNLTAAAEAILDREDETAWAEAADPHLVAQHTATLAPPTVKPKNTPASPTPLTTNKPPISQPAPVRGKPQAPHKAPRIFGRAA
jgi:Putative ATPase subunit of terminase (gpP-like)